MNALKQAPLDAVAFIKRRVRPLVLIVSNCQTFGIANAMQNATDKFEIVGMPITEISNKTDEYYLDHFAKFHHLFVVSALGHLKQIPDFKEKVTIIPAIYFDGYHPDSIYIMKADDFFFGPLGISNSCIVFSAYQSGCAVDEVQRYFSDRIYREVGYYQQWGIAKAAMFSQFRSMGFSADEHFYRWCSYGAFMFAAHHPKSRVLEALAYDGLRKIGCTIEAASDSIADTLGRGVIFPVYPEIATITGAIGSYRFKPDGTNETLSLREFIELSFEAYNRVAREALTPYPAHRSRFEGVSAVIRQQRGG